MERDYNKFFQKISFAEVQPNLTEEIKNAVHGAVHRRLIIRRSLYALVSCLSLVGTVGSLIYVLKALSASGSYEYVSLLSDIKTLSYVKELALSLAESLPFVELALASTIISLFMWSLSKTIKTYGSQDTTQKIYRARVA